MTALEAVNADFGLGVSKKKLFKVYDDWGIRISIQLQFQKYQKPSYNLLSFQQQESPNWQKDSK